MAVKDEFLHHATDDLILASPRNFYRSHMHAIHWQLRGLVASTLDGIYYCHKDEIFRLDPVRRTRQVIAKLDFEPRCLTAGSGWICCGGDFGDFAVLRVGEASRHMPDTAVDARLNLDNHMRSYRPFDERNLTIARMPQLQVTKIATQIVNCVTTWFPPPDSNPEVYKFPVAIVSNNDCTVNVVDLSTTDTIQQLILEDCVNRALMSPDGQHLIAIGDDPFLHIYTRQPKDSLRSGKFSADYHWVQHDKIQLRGQSFNPPRDDQFRGSFAAAFSPSGRYLAVGTQYGFVQVFEADLLTRLDCNPVVATCSSSRPYTPAGAIRNLEFSPSPIDLLAVTENTGRVFVVDVRRDFRSQQSIDLDPHADGLLRVSVSDQTAAPDPHLRTFHSNVASHSASAVPGRTERDSEERRGQPALTSEETAVLEALQQQRAQRDRTRVQDSDESPQRSHTLTDTPWLDPDRPSLTLPQSLRDFVSGRNSTETLRAFIAERNSDRERRGATPRRRGSVILANAQAAFEQESNREAAANNSTGSSSTSQEQDWTRQQQLRREETRHRNARARLREDALRRGDAVEPGSEDGRMRLNDRDNREPHQILTDQFRSEGNRIGLGLPRANDAPNSPWAGLEALYTMATDPSADPTTRMRIELDEEHRLGNVERRQGLVGGRWNDLGNSNIIVSSSTQSEAPGSRGDSFMSTRSYRSPRHYVRLGIGLGGRSMGGADETRSVNPLPGDTTGLCWRADGRLLYVGTEAGIYELHVDMQARKFQPAMKMR